MADAQWIQFCLGTALSWFQGGVLLSVFLLRLYNGEKGSGPWSRWLFICFILCIKRC